MERNQFWIFLALGLAVGACLELVKGPSNQRVRLAGFTHFETLLEEGKEVQITEEVKPKSNRRAKIEEEVIVPHQIAAVEEAPIAQPDTAVKTAEATMSPEEKKKKDEEEKKKKEKDKKKRLKAKKKKREEEERIRKEAFEIQQREEEAQAKKDEKKDDGEVAAAPVGGGLPIVAQAAPDGLPKTVREWEAYLMKDADFERMARFVKLYQTGAVSSTVFYPVITSMLQDSRPKIRDLAVRGLSGTPSAQSFTMLVAVQANDSDKNIRKNAGANVEAYSDLEYLRMLLPVLSTAGSSSAKLEAMQLIKKSANANLKPLGVSAQSTQPSTLAIKKMTRYFQPFVPALQQTALKNDGDVKSAAGSTLTELQTLLASIGIPTSQPQAGNVPNQNQFPPAI